MKTKKLLPALAVLALTPAARALADIPVESFNLNTPPASVLPDAPAPTFFERYADWLPFLVIGVIAIAAAVLIALIVRARKKK